MLKNYFKIAIRNLWKRKAFSLINIAGLAVGMASAVLIILWIVNEVSYDKFHAKKDRIYQAWNRATVSGKLQCWANTPKILAKGLENDIPEIEEAARANWPSGRLFSIGEKRLTLKGSVVDSNFLKVFSFPLLNGNPETVLNDMHSIVITHTLSKKLFGDEDAIGKIVKIDNQDNFIVTGVLKDLPNNTLFKFEYLLPWSYWRYKRGDDVSWQNNSTNTYVLLKANTSFASANEKIKKIKVRYDKTEDPKWEMFLYPIERWRLYSTFDNGIEEGGRITLVKIFGAVAIFILLIACINFMNLSTARSEKRAKEVGIRKVVGAQKKFLVFQFIGESVLLAFIAAILAILIVEISLQGFNDLTDKELFIPYNNLNFLLAAFGFVLLTGFIAGSYPAFFLSSFQPVKVLKGTFKAANALITPRKVLVVFQFVFAAILIISTIVIKQQIDHTQAREIGYNKNNLIYHQLTGDLKKNYNLVKNELLAQNIATSVSKTSSPLTEPWSDSWGMQWEGKDPNDRTDFDRYVADEDLGKTAGLQFIAGRDFNLKQIPTDSAAIILNESAVKAMNFKDPIGKIIKDNGIDWHVVGVIKDFILHSPYDPTRPMVIEGAKGWFNTIHIKLNENESTASLLNKAEKIFKKYNSQYPFEYHFVDEEYAKKFEGEKNVSTLAALFAGLTIFISCLGLFGLATYMAENRIKEIGVRKVLGASVANIATLLSKDFLKLVMIAFVIAIPIAWMAMYGWLEHYPYRVEIKWWVFVITGLLSVTIAIGSVSYQAIKAALANPVKNLRTE
jgi:ABC-type antimicrobial peptide transport system permease subunit